jgi:hypothetical protein
MMSSHPSDRLAKYFMGLYGPPSFARRDRNAQAAWDGILGRCRTTRKEMLDGVRWALQPLAKKLTLTLDEDPGVAMEQVRSATSEKKLSQLSFNTRLLLHQLANAIERFNTKWTKYLQSIDLNHLNSLRNEFNQNFIIEKECATGSELIARHGFAPYSSADHEELIREFPLLKPLSRFLRVPTDMPGPAWGVVFWLVLILINLTIELQFPAIHPTPRTVSILYLWMGGAAIVVGIFALRRKVRELEDEVDRLSR